MYQILVYSDSLSWGIIPGTRQRLPFDQRWPGILESQLDQKDNPVRIIENCLNGRRTVWSDPYKEGRNGSRGLAQVIEMHSPLALVLIMLGTNDFQSSHQNNAWQSAQGVARLVNIICQAPIEPGMPAPEIMLIAPPPITRPKGMIANKFLEAEERSAGFANELQLIAKDLNVHFFDAGCIVEASKVDGIHLDAAEHCLLGKALAKAVIENVDLCSS